MTTQEFYFNKYGGRTIHRLEEWHIYARRAREQLDRYKRIYTVTAPDEKSEDMAVCAMADAMYGFDLIANGEGGPVQSASIGSVSVSYGSSASGAVDISPKGRARELYRCACLYLDICRGVGGR